MNIGHRLKEIRHLKKLNLEDVAKALNMGISTLSEYENDITEPSLSRFYALMDFYNLEPLNLLLHDEEYLRITDYSERGKQIAYSLDAKERTKINLEQEDVEA